MTGPEKDRIYANKLDKIEDFVFDEKVANVFEDMVHRSVPGYGALNQLLPTIAKAFIRENTNVYDLGCSLGEATVNIANSNQKKDVTIIAVDNSQAMMNRLQQRLLTINNSTKIKSVCNDIVQVAIDNASFVIFNYTLQFIDREKRNDLVSKIYSGLIQNGALLLSEKITYEDEDKELLIQKLYENYKRDNQYSNLEISQKREALENVLIRDTYEQHINRLYRAGFNNVYVIAQYLNFISYLAVK